MPTVKELHQRAETRMRHKPGCEACMGKDCNCGEPFRALDELAEMAEALAWHEQNRPSVLFDEPSQLWTVMVAGKAYAEDTSLLKAIQQARAQERESE